MEAPWVMGFDDLPRTEHAHEFVGADHGDVPFSVIFVHAPPDAGPAPSSHTNGRSCPGAPVLFDQ
jgi:hypothetical protein